MTTVYLVRHGQKHSRSGDPGLTELGLEQAQQTGAYFKNASINKLIASPLKRATETAQQISKLLDLDYQTDKSLTERINWDDRQQTIEEFTDDWIKSTHDRGYQPRYGNSSALELLNYTDHLQIKSE
jgi:broad specificity phosphatase PhoE